MIFDPPNPRLLKLHFAPQTPKLPALLCPLHSHIPASLCSLLGSAGGLSRTPVWLHIFITRHSHVALKFHTHDQGLPSNLQRTGGPLLVSPQMSKLLIRNIVVPSGRVGESLLRAEHNAPWPERRTWVVLVQMVTPTLTVTAQKLCWGAAVRWVTAKRKHVCSRV